MRTVRSRREREAMNLEQIRVTLVLDSQKLPIEDDGFVGELMPGYAVLAVETPPDFCGLQVDSAKNLVVKDDESRDPDIRRYETHITISTDANRTLCTSYRRGNHMKLLHTGDDNVLALIEVALISQGGQFFITKGVTHRFRCFNDNGNVRCPYFESVPRLWPQMVQLLADGFADEVDNLPILDEYQPEPEPELNGCGLLEGIVLWWNAAQGLGAIMTHEGAARVHWSQIVSRARLAGLTKGGRVAFAGLTRLTSDRTSFKYEAYGVRSL